MYAIRSYYAPFHLLHQEFGRHRRVAFLVDIFPGKSEQVLGTQQRAFQGLVGLVDPRRPLQRPATFGFARVRKTIGVNPGLKLAKTLVQRERIDAERWRQAKQGEVVGVEVDLVTRRIH